MRESQVKLVNLNSKYVGQSRTEEVSETYLKIIIIHFIKKNNANIG